MRESIGYHQGNEIDFSQYYQGAKNVDVSHLWGVSGFDNMATHVSNLLPRKVAWVDTSEPVCLINSIVLDIVTAASAQDGDVRVSFFQLMTLQELRPSTLSSTESLRGFLATSLSNPDMLSDYRENKIWKKAKNNIETIEEFLIAEWRVQCNKCKASRFHWSIRGGSSKKRSYVEHWLDIGLRSKRGFLHEERGMLTLARLHAQDDLLIVHGDILSSIVYEDIMRTDSEDVTNGVLYLSNVGDYLETEAEIKSLKRFVSRFIALGSVVVFHSHCRWPYIWYMNHTAAEFKLLIEKSIRNGNTLEHEIQLECQKSEAKCFYHMWSDEYR